jgi:hypothetical protein
MTAWWNDGQVKQKDVQMGNCSQNFDHQDEMENCLKDIIC